MDFIIHPLKGINDIEFGMKKEEVRQLIGVSPVEFRRHDEAHLSDHFENEGAFAYYDADGHLEAMEFSPPSRALLGVVNVLDLPFGQAASLLNRIDSKLVTDKDMVTSKRYCLSLWSSAGFEEKDEPVEALLVGREGYYDSLISVAK
jgi:hypothetical protein